MNTKLKKMLVTLICLLPIQLAALENDKTYKAVEMPGTHIVPLKDTQNNRQYELLVKLPQNYSDAENKQKRYPVIYFTDAVVAIESLSSSVDFILEDSILVGISYQKDNDEKLVAEHGEMVSRFRDYSPWPHDKPDIQTTYHFGQADKHLNFIRKEIFNYIAENYRTQPDNRSYFGYSLGGLFGAYILINKPDTFKNYMLGSPSVWKSGRVTKMPYPEKTGFNANVFVSVGTLEDRLSPHVDAFVTYLKNSQDPTLALTHKKIEGTHATACPATGVQAISWLANTVTNGK